ncbi:rCG31008, isoform CRA_a, partial [Rattus norvegicus]
MENPQTGKLRQGDDVLVSVTIAVMNIMAKSKLGKERFLWVTLPHELTQGWNLEAGADAEAMEEDADWLAPHGLLSLLSYRTQDPQ